MGMHKTTKLEIEINALDIRLQKMEDAVFTLLGIYRFHSNELESLRKELENAGVIARKVRYEAKRPKEGQSPR